MRPGVQGIWLRPRKGREACRQNLVRRRWLKFENRQRTWTPPYENLDLSKAKITIPEVDEVYEVYDLTFPTSTDSFERQIEKLQENIRKYEGIGEDVDLTQYMSLMYWDLEKDDRLTIPIREAADQQKKEVQYVGYNDGKCS